MGVLQFTSTDVFQQEHHFNDTRIFYLLIYNNIHDISRKGGDALRVSVVKPCITIAIVSGGLDSTCYLALWLYRGCDAYVLTFDYGQKGLRELDIARRIIEKLNTIAATNGWGRVIEHRVIDMKFLKELWRGTQLTDEVVEVREEYQLSVVVPIRNVVMLAIAAAYAYTIRELTRLKVYVVYGAQLDDAGYNSLIRDFNYPDCTPECVQSLENAFKICHFREARDIEVWSPSRENMSKAELLRSCYSLIGDLVYYTWSCYLSGEVHCGKCESCVNRIKAFRDAGIPDKTIYKTKPAIYG